GAVEASHFTDIQKGKYSEFVVLKPYGRHKSAIKMFPNTSGADKEKDIPEQLNDLPYAEYTFVTDKESEYEAEFVFAPSLPVNDSNSQCFAYSVNGDEAVVTDTILDKSRPIFNSHQWAVDNRRNAKIISGSLNAKKGINSIRYYQVDPNLILERIVLWDKDRPVRESYLGPKESFRF
ncbi:MAG: hypothetical protein J6Y89_02445, partial [Lachnospiraceae bacterium]|nr:hypothetical protein [Lachnospiraceae bacterium]